MATTETVLALNNDGTTREVTVTTEDAPPDPLEVFDAASAGTLSLAKLKAAYRAALEAQRAQPPA